MNIGKKTDKQRTMMKTEKPNNMNKKETRTWATYKWGNVRKTKDNSNENNHERNIRKPNTIK